MLEKNIHFYAPSHYSGKGHIKAVKEGRGGGDALL